MQLFNSIISLLGFYGSYRTCFTPNGERGRCVPSERCQFILDVQRIYRGNVPPVIQNQIKQMNCYGDPKSTFHLCCPLKSVINRKKETTIKKSEKIEQLNPRNLSYIDPHGLRLLKSFTECGKVTEHWAAGWKSIAAVSHGIFATDGELGWMVALKYDTTGRPFLCGGTLITDRFVVTAAHCTTGPVKLIGVLVGEINLDYLSRNTEYDIEDIRPHPLYKKSGISYDIALIKLVKTVHFEYPIRPICLPIERTSQNIPNDEIFYVAGWGKTEYYEPSSYLLKAMVMRQDLDVCRNYFLNASLTDNHICAVGNDFQHSCQGDSGGPLFFKRKSNLLGTFRYVQLGIISTGGIHCGAHDNQPGVFASVVDMLPWITQNFY